VAFGDVNYATRARKPEFLLSLALGCVYLATMSGHLHSIDGLLVFQQAKALVYEQSLTFGAPVHWPHPIATSKYGIGLSLLYVPGLVVWSWLLPYAPGPSAQPYDVALL
jgi:hypothetical protein